ncbi:MAG TPA: alpha/beta fold hydrolase [Gemmatales bacterium]|nr:alpha/beta fold hydrolase [Gemmatales bacterium]
MATATERGRFRPLLGLGNPHLQTLVGHFVAGPEFGFPSTPRPLTLSDGDRLLWHDSIPPTWQPGARVVVLIHGMGGSHRSGYLQRTARRFRAAGWRTVRVDLRGCGAALPLARRQAHGGLSSDVRQLLETVAAAAPGSPVLLVGFSLGGNVVLKTAGEGLPSAVRAVAAVAPPLDLNQCSSLISHPRNRVYDLFFVNDLVRQARQRERHFPEVKAPRLLGAAKTLRGFDDVYTAPVWGFADAAEYYRLQSSRPWVERIAVPTLLLTARDDPFIAVEPFESIRPGGAVRVESEGRGGHLGFLGLDGGGGIRWAEARLQAWGDEVLGGGGS